MAKKATYNSLIKYNDWSARKLIDEARNVARWNPWIAHDWMREASYQITGIEQYRLMEYHDAAVEEINAWWRMLTRMRFYKEKEFWQGIPPKMLIKMVPDDDNVVSL